MFLIAAVVLVAPSQTVQNSRGHFKRSTNKTEGSGATGREEEHEQELGSRTS